MDDSEDGADTHGQDLEKDANESPAKSGWPQLSETQQQDFQKFIKAEIGRRKDVLETSVDHELTCAEVAQSLGQQCEAPERIKRAKELKEKLGECGNPSTEELGQPCWRYLAHIGE